MNRLVVFLAAVTFCLLVGCTSSRTDRVSDRNTNDTPAKVDTTEPGFDPAEQLSIAANLRDQLVAKGIQCDGEASTPDPDISVGVVAALDCPIDGIQVEITVYRSEDAKQAGIDEIQWFSCLEGKRLQYVDGEDWVVGASSVDGGDSDDEMTERIGLALDAPVKAIKC